MIENRYKYLYYDPKKLEEWLTLDEEKGEIFWKQSPTPRIKVGDKVGYKGAKDYYRLKLQGQVFLFHRVVWALYTGSWPKECLDHINGDKTDNRPVNLREASWTENRRNTSFSKGSSRFTGVTWNKATNKWMARFRETGNYRYLGLFNTEEEAATAYNKVAAERYGEFARLNNVS